MNTILPLSIVASFDRKLAAANGTDMNFLVVSAVAPAYDQIRRYGPLNLAIVIDVSDSMSGKPLEAAKQAAIGVVNSLGDKDLLSLVSFADDRIVHFEQCRLDRGGKRNAVKQIDHLTVRGSTNLSAGWFGGATCVAEGMKRNPSCQNHVLVLSDGFANLGIVEPPRLARHAMELQMRGIITSAVGIGDHYSAAQLHALAENGGGRIHDAQYPAEIIEVVTAHLRELQRMAFEAVRVSIEFPEVQSFENLSGFPINLQSNRLEVLFGSLLADSERSCIFKVKPAFGTVGEKLTFRLTAQYQEVGMPVTVDSDHEVLAELTYAESEQASMQARNLEVSQKVAKTWQASIVGRVAEMNRSGQFMPAIQYIDHQLNLFMPYCEDLPNCDQLVQQLLEMRMVANVRWDERVRKELQYATYTTTHNHLDTRVLKRAHWTTFLPKDQSQAK